MKIIITLPWSKMRELNRREEKSIQLWTHYPLKIAPMRSSTPYIHLFLKGTHVLECPSEPSIVSQKLEYFSNLEISRAL